MAKYTNVEYRKQAIV